MPWLELDSRTPFQKFCTKVLATGNIPKHVGVIMDGNRRYAQQHDLPLGAVYQMGSDKLDEMLRWAYELGIKEVTAYAFSIENFKRSEGEQLALFRVLKRRFENELDCDGEECFEDGKTRIFFSVRVIGDWSLIPEDLKEVMAEVAIKRRRNTRLILNLAVAYTSRHEIATRGEAIRRGICEGKLKSEDISVKFLTDTIQFLPSHPVDILIRTSGTHRLSDFLLWQSAEGILHFVNHNWPDLSFWDLTIPILTFQQRYNKIINLRQRILGNENNEASSKNEDSKRSFFEKLRDDWWYSMEQEVNT